MIFRALIFFIIFFSYDLLHLHANNLPIDLGVDTTLCDGQSLSIVIPLIGDTLNYTWSTGDTLPNISITTSGTYSVTVTSPACTGMDTIHVNFIPSPTVSLSSENVCFGSQTTIVSNSNHDSLALYNWDFGDGQLSNISTDTVLHTYGVNGQDYLTSLSITNANGCFNSDTILVQSLLNPTADFIVDDVCLNDNSIIINNSENISDEAIVTIHYGNGDSLISSNQQNYSTIYQSPQTYNLFVDIENNNGCSDSQMLTTNINPLPSPSFSGLEDSYCQYSEVDTLTGSPLGGLFTGIDVTDDGLFTPLTNNDSIAIVYTYIDENGCIGVAEDVTEVYEKTEVSFLVTDSVYCVGNQNDTLEVNYLEGNFFGDFLISDSTLASNMIVFTPLEIGIFPIDYTAIDTNNCSVEVTQNLIVEGVNYLDLPSDTFIISGDTLILSLGQENPAYNYLWSNGTTNPFIEIQNPGFYIATITDLASGCSQSDTVLVNFGSNIEIVNNIESLKLFPNPVFDELNISFFCKLDGETDIIILNSLGQHMYSEKAFLKRNEYYNFIIYFANYSPGFYFLKIGENVLKNSIIKIE